MVEMNRMCMEIQFQITFTKLFEKVVNWKHRTFDGGFYCKKLWSAAALECMQACFEFSLHFYVIYRNKSTEKCVQIQNTSGRYPVLQQAYECICY